MYLVMLDDYKGNPQSILYSWGHIFI